MHAKDQYYHTYYIRSCGGDYGTPVDFHPFRGKPELREVPTNIHLNITMPVKISGEGGTLEFELNYICRRNYCSGNKLSYCFHYSVFQFDNRYVKYNLSLFSLTIAGALNYGISWLFSTIIPLLLCLYMIFW